MNIPIEISLKIIEVMNQVLLNPKTDPLTARQAANIIAAAVDSLNKLTGGQ